MIPLKSVVLDANIIIRSVLGVKVASFMEEVENLAHFVTPDICLADARKYLPIIATKRELNLNLIEEGLSKAEAILDVIPEEFYRLHEDEAKERIAHDVDDWPVVATALLFNCPIWTEDRDFFGVGIETWTSNKIHLYFRKE